MKVQGGTKMRGREKIRGNLTPAMVTMEYLMTRHDGSVF